MHVVDEIKPINYKGLKETLEAGTGIEPVFTDLQSDKILNYVNILR